MHLGGIALILRHIFEKISTDIVLKIDRYKTKYNQSFDLNVKLTKIQCEDNNSYYPGVMWILGYNIICIFK